jgi:metallo-beta-lactamase class B
MKSVNVREEGVRPWHTSAPSPARCRLVRLHATGTPCARSTTDELSESSVLAKCALDIIGRVPGSSPSFYDGSVRRYVFATALFVLSCSSVPAQLARYEPDWNRPAAPHRVVSNVYFVGTTELGVFLIATRDGHILLDPGFDETVPLIEASMTSLGFEYQDIRLLLVTQAHFDHAAGLARIARDTGARVEAMREDAVLLEQGGRDDFRFGDELTFPPVRVDRVLTDGDTVEQGGVRLVARHTPGHTKGATTFVTTVQEGGRAYQMVFATSTTINPGTSLVDNERYPGILTDWQRTYAILESLVADVWVSAHTSFFDMDGKLARIGTATANPYVDPLGFRRFVANGRARFAATLAEQLAGPVSPSP